MSITQQQFQVLVGQAADFAAVAVADKIAGLWQGAIPEHLAARMWMVIPYRNSIKVYTPGINHPVEVGFPGIIGGPTAEEKIALLAELGAPDTDMRDYMLSGEGVRINAKGAKYRFVPMDRTAKKMKEVQKATEEGQSRETVKSLRKEMKRVQGNPTQFSGATGSVEAKGRDPEGGRRSTQMQGALKARFGKEEGAERYASLARMRSTHKDILTERAYAYTAAYAHDAAKGAVTKQFTGMRIFRTISESQDDGSWMRKAVAPANVWLSVKTTHWDEIQQEATTVFNAELRRLMGVGP